MSRYGVNLPGVDSEENMELSGRTTYIEGEEDIPLVHIWLRECFDFILDISGNIDVDTGEGFRIDVQEVLHYVTWKEFVVFV